MVAGSSVVCCYHGVGKIDFSLPIKDGSLLLLPLSSGDDVSVEMNSLGWF